MKRFLLSMIWYTLFISLHAVQIPATPGTPVWALANQDALIVTTIESQVDALAQNIDIDFNGTFTALDELLTKICTVQSQAEQLASNVSILEANLNNDASKMCVINSKADALLIDVQAIDTQNTFTALETLQQTLCSKVELLNAELVDVETDITNITQSEIEYNQTIASKLSVIDTNVNTINSILDNLEFDAHLASIDSLLDVIDTCLATVSSKLDPLQSTIETNFTGTFTALEANLQKACTIESLADEIPMSFMVDLSGVYTALNELEQTMCTIESKVDNLDMSILTIESDIDLLNTNIDNTLSKLCALESKTEIASCSQCFSLMENIGTNLSNDCSILDVLNDNQLLSKTYAIDSNIDIIINKIPTQNSKFEVIASEVDIVESKICAIEMNNTSISKLDIIDSKVDVAQETTLTIASLVDVIDQTSQTIESIICTIDLEATDSKLDIIVPETQTISSNLDELILTWSTIDSKLDTILATNAGQLCSDFGNTGTITTGFAPLSTDDANDVAIQTDGKIVVVGQTNAVSGFDFALARYLANGSLDISFGIGGLVTTDISGLGVDNALGVAIQADGKIVVAGQTTLAGTTSIVLVRYNIDGSLDTTFNGTGIVITPPIGPNTVSLANAIHIQADGKIVIAGGTGLAAATDFLLARYNIDGSLDATFGVAGIATIDLGGIDIAHALLIQADGRIVAVGVSGASFAVARLTTAGILDTTFGGGSGIVVTSIGAVAVANAALLQANGKIIVAGYSDLLGSNNFALARYNIDGSLDTSFGQLGTGIVVQSFVGISVTLANAALLQADGKIILIGSNDIGGAISFSLARFNSNGTVDLSFGINGQVTTTFSTGVSIDIAHAATLTPNDQLIAIGQTNESGSLDFALACYELDTPSIFLIEQKVNAICTELEQLSTSSLHSKLELIESFVCTIESNVDIVDSLVDNANMKTIDLETDFASTWTILDVIENKLCTSESFLENASDNLTTLHSSIDHLEQDFAGTFTVIAAIQMKANTVDTKVDTIEDIDFSGVFTALDTLESKICLIDNLTSRIDQGITEISDALGTPIYNSDLPSTISTAGRYYVAEDLDYVATATAIFIDASNVTLDLNGYTLAGASNPSVTGISTGSSLENITITNGTIRDFANESICIGFANNNIVLREIAIDECNNGINLEESVSEVLMDSLSCINGTGSGISIRRDVSNVRIKRSFISNIINGIFAGPGGASRIFVSDCTFTENQGNGLIFVNASLSTIENCVISENGTGLRIQTNGEGFSVLNVLATGNSDVGFIIPVTASIENILIHNSAIENENGGFVFGGTGTRDNYCAFNTAIENGGSTPEANFRQFSGGPNTFLGNFALHSGASGASPPNNTNYFISSGSNITGKFVTISQNGAFPATRPTEWHNINMLP